MGLLISLGLHALLFLLWPSVGGGPESPFAAAGPRAGDDRAAEGTIQALQMQSAPPEVTRPPAPLTFDVVTEEPPEFDPDADIDVELTDPELPPGRGSTTGTDAQDGNAGLPAGTGAGDGGTTEEGRFRVTPPVARGVIMPPTDRDVRGELEVWVFVNEEGRVVADSTRLEPPTSNREFNEQVIREAAQWLFEPAREGGEPVASWWYYRVSMQR